MKTSVVIADDHVAVRELLAAALEREGSYLLAGQAGTGFEALKVCRRLKPRLLILELALAEMNGTEVMRTLRAEQRDLRVLIFTGTNQRDLVLAALEARPHGFVHKQDSLVTLYAALQAVRCGSSYLTPFATGIADRAAVEGPRGGMLSGRERTVLQMIAEGMSSKEMASRLSLAPKTVEHHRARLMEKLDLHDVAHLTRYAVALGIVAAER